MNYTCSVAGCAKKAKRHGGPCSKHQINRRRHGHEKQVPVSAFELRRHARHVRKLIDCRPNREDIWTSLLAAHDMLLSQANAEVSVAKASKGIVHRPAYEAAQAIVTVCSEAQAEDVVIILVTLGYLQEFDPKRFVSDDAFRMTMALRFRRLASSSFYRTINPSTGAKLRPSHEFPPRTQLMLGRRLATGFAAFGAELCRAEFRDTRRTDEVKRALLAVLEGEKAA